LKKLSIENDKEIIHPELKTINEHIWRLHTANEIFTDGVTDTTFVVLVMPLDCTTFLHTNGAALTSVLTGTISIIIITYATNQILVLALNNCKPDTKLQLYTNSDMGILHNGSDSWSYYLKINDTCTHIWCISIYLYKWITKISYLNLKLLLYFKQEVINTLLNFESTPLT
jgi:hypothetical protein